MPRLWPPALQDVVDRHEILRTAFAKFPGMDLPLQVVSEQVAVAWELADTPAAGTEQTPFDFARPPLARFRLARPEPDLQLRAG